MEINNNHKKIILIVIVIAIIGSIYYLNSQKAIQNNNEVIPIEDIRVSNEQQDESLIDVENIDIEIEESTEILYVPDEKIINEKKLLYLEAPELVGISGYINTDSNFKIRDLKGEVVLVDFWTYTCINCIRTMPYLRNWYDKYTDEGLVMVGVHTPEFEFEKIFENVLDAVEKYDLKYPVVQDNNYATWKDYRNRYWPRKYLIDIDGFIRYDHIGEGGYEETERKIMELLKERAERLKTNQKIGEFEDTVEIEDTSFREIKTPEIYFGYKFARGNFGNEEGLQADKTIEFKIPEQLFVNYAYIDGTWKTNEDDSELISDSGSIILIYSAKLVNIVAGSENGSEIEILVDKRQINELNRGSDVKLEGNTLVKDFRLYNVVDYQYGKHTIQINIKGKGFKINTFTFG